MSFVNFIAALSPILFVLIGILAFRKPAMKVALPLSFGHCYWLLHTSISVTLHLQKIL